MNIPQLLHNCPGTQTISHWPVFVMNQSGKNWYFYSSKGVTLRKKIENTQLVNFLKAPNVQQIQEGEGDVMILEVREIDRRQPKYGELYTIKVNKIPLQNLQPTHNQTQQTLLIHNNWVNTPNHQISLYKIPNPHKNKLHFLRWSQNLLLCKAPLNTHQKNRLSKYAEIIRDKVNERMFKEKGCVVRQFQLVFTHDIGNGRIGVVFAHNFVLGTTGDHSQVKGMYETDLKIGGDDLEELEILLEEENKNKQNIEANLRQPVTVSGTQIFSQQAQQKRLQYLKLLQKLSQNPQLPVSLKKQDQPVRLIQQFQCSCCHSYVKVKEFEHKKMITSNRIPQVQIARQVRMKNMGIGNGIGEYELVAVCDQCYEKFREIVDIREKMNKTRANSVKSRQNSVRQKTQTVIASSVGKKLPIEKNFKPNLTIIDAQNTTKTNTTTINHEIKNSKPEKNKLSYYLGSQGSQRHRKASLHLQDPTKTQQSAIQILNMKGQKTLNPSIQRNHTFHHHPAMVSKTDKNLDPDFETDDQLTCAVVEYQECHRLDKNREKIRNFRNVHRWRKKPI